VRRDSPSLGQTFGGDNPRSSRGDPVEHGTDTRARAQEDLGNRMGLHQSTMTFTRRVVSGTAQLAIGNGVVRLLAIVTMPILTSLLSPQAYGVAALAGTIISLASVLALAGIDTSYLRAYHSTAAPCGAAAEHYCWRYATFGALAGAALGAAAWYWFGEGTVDKGGGLAILVALGVALSVVSTMSQCRALARGQHSAMARSIVMTGIIATAASIAIAMWRQDAVALLVSMLLGYLIPVLLLGTPSLAELTRRSHLHRDEAAALVKIGLAGIVTAPMYWILSSSDRWFLQHYQGAEVVGVYSIGYSVAIVGLMVNAAVMAVWQPESVREYEGDLVEAQVTLGTLMSRIVAALAVMWLATTAAGGDIVRWLANERFHGAADYVPYIAGGVFFYGILRLATTDLLLAKQMKWAALWWLLGGVVCTLLNLALVPRYGGVGAAVAQCLSFAFIASGILATAQGVFRVRLNWVGLAVTLLAVLAAGIVMTPPWHASGPISLLLKLPAGMVVAAAVAWLMAPDWCLNGIAYLRRRVL
jgi:O-antigen/teichoic acid export membrane protein